jgi:hypothetical protein
MNLASQGHNFSTKFTSKIAPYMRLTGLLLALGLFVSGLSSASAKDLSNRMGVGISNIGNKTTESVSLDWQLTNATGVEANFGLATQSDAGGWDLGFRASRNLFIEENMLFSLFVGAALKQNKVAGASSTGYLIETGVGSKFFFEGLPNLGFSFRGAFQIVDIGDLKLQIAPIFGIHYYF